MLMVVRVQARLHQVTFLANQWNWRNDFSLRAVGAKPAAQLSVATQPGGPVVPTQHSQFRPGRPAIIARRHYQRSRKAWFLGGAVGRHHHMQFWSILVLHFYHHFFNIGHKPASASSIRRTPSLI